MLFVNINKVCSLFKEHQAQILSNWINTVKHVAGIGSSEELAVFRSVFTDLLESFIHNVGQDDLPSYYAANTRMARKVVNIGVPLQKLLLAFHAFEDAYMDVLLAFAHEELIGIIRRLDHIHHTTMAIISEEYMAVNDWNILAIAKLCEIRDAETNAHLERTRDYCSLLASAYGKDDIYIQLLRKAAPLHDLGKIQTPDSILFKPGPLTRDEFEIIRKHPQQGADILDSILKGKRISAGAYTMMRDVVLCHHEKFDGSGYPRGLKGGDIPLAALITALADAYDCITSKRPYKEPLSHAEAVARIKRDSGRHFDPDLVEAFLQVAHEMDKLRWKNYDGHTFLETELAEIQGTLISAKM